MTTTALTHSMTEEQLLQAIPEAATLLGWRWHHVRRSDKALQQGHPGFPDLVLARNGRVLFLELKAANGRSTQAQREWASHLYGVGGNPDFLWVWPPHLDAILALLK